MLLTLLLPSGSGAGSVSASMTSFFESQAWVYSDACTGDDFNRTNGTLGGSWSTVTGLTSPNITSNKVSS